MQCPRRSRAGSAYRHGVDGVHRSHPVVSASYSNTQNRRDGRCAWLGSSSAGVLSAASSSGPSGSAHALPISSRLTTLCTPDSTHQSVTHFLVLRSILFTTYLIFCSTSLRCDPVIISPVILTLVRCVFRQPRSTSFRPRDFLALLSFLALPRSRTFLNPSEYRPVESPERLQSHHFNRHSASWFGRR